MRQKRYRWHGQVTVCDGSVTAPRCRRGRRLRSSHATDHPHIRASRGPVFALRNRPGGWLDLAGSRSGDHAVSERRRPLCRRPAPRDRRRGARGQPCGCGGRRDGDVRRRRGLVRADGVGALGRRSLRPVVPPPLRYVRSPRRACLGGRGPRRGGHFGPALGRGPAPALRGARGGFPDRYRDPLDFLAPPPAGDAPDPAPAPVPVAHPAGPEPAPAPTAAPAVAPAPTPAPAPVAASPAPAPRAAVPIPAFHASPHPAAVHADLPHLLANSAPAHIGHRPTWSGPHPNSHMTARTPLAGPRSAVPGMSAHGTSPSAAPQAHRSGASHDGIDLGWLAACIGLIAVATALGHPDATRRTAARGRSSVGALLRLSRGVARQ